MMQAIIVAVVVTLAVAGFFLWRSRLLCQLANSLDPGVKLREVERMQKAVAADAAALSKLEKRLQQLEEEQEAERLRIQGASHEAVVADLRRRGY
jgi:hypothetical protein